MWTLNIFATKEIKLSELDPQWSREPILENKYLRHMHNFEIKKFRN